MREEHHVELVGECGSGKSQLCMQVNLTCLLWQGLITRSCPVRHLPVDTVPIASYVQLTRGHLCGA